MSVFGLEYCSIRAKLLQYSGQTTAVFGLEYSSLSARILLFYPTSDLPSPSGAYIQEEIPNPKLKVFIIKPSHSLERQTTFTIHMRGTSKSVWIKQKFLLA